MDNGTPISGRNPIHKVSRIDRGRLLYYAVIGQFVITALHLVRAWRTGAYAPNNYNGSMFPTFSLLGLSTLVLCGLTLWTIVFDIVRLRSVRLRSAIIAPVALAFYYALPRLSDADRLRDIAFNRDIGMRAQAWAINALSRPKSDLVDVASYKKVQQKVRADLVPVYFKRGGYDDTYLLDSSQREYSWFGANEPLMMVSYGYKLSGGYLIGTTSLRIPHSTGIKIHRISAGVYRYSFY